MMVAGLLLAGGCGPVVPQERSPLCGSWTGINASGGGYFGTVAFGLFGDLESLDISTPKGSRLFYRFDRQPHLDIDGNQYVASAETTVTASEFQAKARIEYTQGKHKGITRVTMDGSLDGRSMAGSVRIAWPDSAAFEQPFTAQRQ